MPLNNNGKVDRKALPAPELGSESRVIVAPRNELEKQLLEVFCGVLQRSDCLWTTTSSRLAAVRCRR